MKRITITSGDEGRLVVQTQWSFYPFLGFLGFLLFLFLIPWLSSFLIVGLNPIVLAELQPFILVFVTAIILYVGTFVSSGTQKDRLLHYKMHWLGDSIFLAGILSTIIGSRFVYHYLLEFMLVEAGEILPENLAQAMGSGMTIALVGFLYGLLGYSVFSLLCKRLESGVYVGEQPGVSNRFGFYLRAVVSILLSAIIIGFILMLIGFQNDINPIPLFFNGQVVILVLAVGVGTSLVYGIRPVLNALQMTIWRFHHNEDNLQSLIRIIRGTKRILALIIIAITAVFPIIILKGMGVVGRSVTENLGISIATLFGQASPLFCWSILLILYCHLLEGQTVQNMYFLSGKILRDDRYFIFKFVLPPAILFLIMVWIVIALYFA